MSRDSGRRVRALVAQRGGALPSGVAPTAPKRRKAAPVLVEAGVVLFFTVPGPPRTKKTSQRIWKVGKRKVVIPSDAWMAWRDAVKAWFMERPATWRREMSGHDGRMNCEALFYRDAERGDATGYYQGLADVLEEIGVVTNDKHLTQWDGSRLLVDRDNPRVVVTLTPVG